MAKAAAEDTEADTGDKRATDSVTTPESVAAGLQALPAELLAAAVALLPAAHQSAIALAIDG